MMRARWILVGVAALAALGLAVFFLAPGARARRTPGDPTAPDESGQRATVGHQRAWTASPPGVTAAAAASKLGPLLDRRKADEMRAQIHALLAEAGAAWGTSPEPFAPTQTAPLSATGRPLEPMPDPLADGGNAAMNDYVRERVHEDFFPLAKKCYENELERNPKLAGTAVLRFRIVGDKRVGGVVDQARIDDKESDLKSDGFAQCLSESMMSVSFGAPPEHETTVRYPFVFSPDEEEPDASPPP